MALLRALDVLARLRLRTRRAGVELTVVYVTDELREVIELAGLGEVLLLELQREPEEREEPLRVEEERQLPDPPVG
ncbi:MAG TPA: hypothetical protein VFA30_07925 [Gaiellaceae bacterium]|nr:hypothetical protein [Gaiellaceae bacterium]